MFEFLDEDRTGMISSKDLMHFLEISERLKASQFEHKTYMD
jgi:Ca2+-binding EF-hand superfamily protein